MADRDERVDAAVVVTADAYDEALTAYVDHVPPRTQVPSRREVDGGVVDYEFRPAPPPPKIARVRPLKRFVEDLKFLNPWHFAKRETIYPLFVLSGLAAGSWLDSTFRAVAFLIQADLGIDIGFIFAVMGLMDLVTVLSAPVVGFVADHIKRVHMLRFGTLVNGLCIVATAFAGSPAGIVLARVGAQLGLATYLPAAAPLVADHFTLDKRARAFGFQAIAAVGFSMIGAAVLTFGVYMTAAISWRQLILGAGILAIAISILTFKLKEPVRGESDRLSMGVSEDAARRAQKAASWRESWRICSNIGTLRRLWWAQPFLYLGQRGIPYVLYVALQAKTVKVLTGGIGGVPPWLGRLLPGVMLLLPALLQLILTPVAYAVADKLLKDRPGRIMVFFGMAMTATGMLPILAVFSPPLIMILLSVVVSALIGMIAPAQSLLLSVVIPARVRGQGMQTVQPFQLPGVIVFISLGSIIAAYGEIATALILVPFLFIGTGILIYSSRDVARDLRNAIAAGLAEETSQRARAEGRAKMIVMRDVSVSYDGAQVLFDVDFDVDDGEIVAILGTNGAGKSTLLRAIAGLHEPEAGAIFLDGEDITHKPAFLNAREGIVFLPGGRAVFPTLTVDENLRAAAWLYKEDDDYVRTRTEEVLDFFPVLRERLKQRAGDLSGGEQQMLALGQAFLMRPRLLMIDELSLGLAPQVVMKLLDIVRAIHAHGTTVILVEQSVNVALTVADRAVFMDAGEIRFDGRTEDLTKRGDLVRAVFLGHAGGGRLVGLGTKAKPRYGEDPERVLSVEDVRVSYGGVVALDGVSLGVSAGEIVGIIGPNGAGKTTLFDVIAGTLTPDGGRVTIGGKAAEGLAPDARAHLGLARSFQDTRLFPSLTVRETIAVSLQRRVQARNPLLAAAWAPAVRKAEKRASRRVEYLIDLLGLGAHADKFISELSTGTRRMIDIACVMATEPKILLLDEPSSGLAQAEIEVLGPVVQQLVRESGCGVLVIEHDIPLIVGLSDRLLAMQLGTVIAEGEPDRVAADPRVVGAYLNASQDVIKRSGALEQSMEHVNRLTGE